MFRNRHGKRCLVALVLAALLAGAAWFGWTQRWRLLSFDEAIGTGDLEATRAWLRAYPDRASRPFVFGDRTTTPLHLAVAHDRLDIVELLLDHGADPNGRDMIGQTPLHEAGECRHGRTYRVLAHSNEEVIAAIQKPRLYVDPRIGELLIRRGADVSAQDFNRRTPLHLAARSAHLKMVELLLKNGADCNCLDDKNDTPLSLLCNLVDDTYAKPQSLTIAETLVRAGARVDTSNVDGNTPLHLLMSRYPPPDGLVQFLLQHGAHTRTRNRAGRVPTEELCYFLHENARKILEHAESSRLLVPVGAQGGPVPIVPAGRTSAADAVQGDYFNVSPEPASAGEKVTLRFRLRNTGKLPTGPLDVHFYLSRTLPVRTSDRHLGTCRVEGLDADAFGSLVLCSLNLPNWRDGFWRGNGTYYIGLSLDGPDTDRSIQGAGTSGDRMSGLWEVFEDLYVVCNLPPSVPGRFDDGTWHLLRNGDFKETPEDPRAGPFGQAGDVPLCGDLDGNGKDQFVVYRNGTWYFDSNDNGSYEAGDRIIGPFGGQPGDQPVLGNWDGTGRIRIGIFRNGYFHLDLQDSGKWEEARKVGPFGYGSDKAVVGDWIGDGKTRVGVFRNGTWYLDLDGDGTWGAGDKVASFGIEGDLPVVGDWSGDGIDRIGVVRGGTWYLDKNGTGTFDPGDLTVFPFGSQAHIPVVGRWKLPTRAR